LLAGTDPGDPQTFFSWFQFGVLGLVIAAALFGWIWFKPAVDNLLERLERLEKKLDDREDFIRTIVMPAVSESNELLKEVAAILARRRAG
jgi:hypothetical protein